MPRSWNQPSGHRGTGVLFIIPLPNGEVGLTSARALGSAEGVGHAAGTPGLNLHASCLWTPGADRAGNCHRPRDTGWSVRTPPVIAAGRRAGPGGPALAAARSGSGARVRRPALPTPTPPPTSAARASRTREPRAHPREARSPASDLEAVQPRSEPGQMGPAGLTVRKLSRPPRPAPLPGTSRGASPRGRQLPRPHSSRQRSAMAAGGHGKGSGPRRGPALPSPRCQRASAPAPHLRLRPRPQLPCVPTSTSRRGRASARVWNGGGA